MKPLTLKDIAGLEYDWLGCDSTGRVALFSTAGSGWAPQAMLQDPEAHHDAIRAILSLPPTTQAVTFPEVSASSENTWRLVAERGLFAYDNDPNGGDYTLDATPAASIVIDALPDAIARVIRRVTFASIKFAERDRLSNSEIANELMVVTEN